MTKFKVRFSKENWKKIFETVVECETESQAFKIAMDRAERDGHIIPDEVWTRITEI